MTDSAKTKMFKILVGAMFPIILGLVGALYANMDKRIDAKADMSEIMSLREDIKSVKDDTKLIIKMHMKNGRD